MCSGLSHGHHTCWFMKIVQRHKNVLSWMLNEISRIYNICTIWSQLYRNICEFVCVLCMCVFTYTHIKVKNDIKEIHQNVNKVGLWVSILFFILFNMFQSFVISILYFYGQKKLFNKSYIYLQGCVNHTRSLSTDVISSLWNCYIPQLYCC